MNKVILIGRLTKDPEVRNTSSQATVCRFTLAVDRKFKDQNGQRQADFISCVAWRQTAYDDQNGQKRYVTDVVVDEAEFVDSASNGNNGTAQRSGGNNYNNGGYSRPSYPEQGSSAGTASQAPVAPNKQIVPDMPDDTTSFTGSDDDLSLPFPIDDDTGNISF